MSPYNRGIIVDAAWVEVWLWWEDETWIITRYDPRTPFELRPLMVSDSR